MSNNPEISRIQHQFSIMTKILAVMTAVIFVLSTVTVVALINIPEACKP